jgi:copper oxidase (laccase) domain-containing protein
VSQHIVQDERFKFVFGWDQPLQSFYLQKHDPTQSEEEQIVVWLGATADTKMYEVEDLVHVAHRNGLRIGHQMRVKLYGEKDDGK